jgi:hypothetical protein
MWRAVVNVNRRFPYNLENIVSGWGTVSFWRMAVPLSITNMVQRYTIFFITVNAVHVSGSFSAHHQELCVQFWAPDDGRRSRLKHVEHWQ